MKGFKKVSRVGLVLSLFVLLLCGIFIVSDKSLEPAFGQTLQSSSPQEILVKFKPGVDVSTIDFINTLNETRIKNTIPAIEVYVLEPTENNSLTQSQLVDSYQQNPNVQYADPNGIVQALYTPNDPLWNEQWGPKKIEADKAYDIYQGDSSTIIAILDTGVDFDHEDLKDKLIVGVSFEGSSDDGFGHGTHCAGIAAAVTNNAKGVAGVAPDCKLMTVKVLSDEGYGSYEGVAAGIVYAANSNAKVISMSLGGGYVEDTFQDAINYAYSKGCVIVAARGNMASDDLSSPACNENVISVAATGSDDTLAYFSSYGRGLDISAPGLKIKSCLPNHPNYLQDRGANYGYLSGTSMACPHVAGLAGLLASLGLPNYRIEEIIKSSADDLGAPGYDERFGYGRINVRKALIEAVVEMGPPSMPTGLSISDIGAGGTLKISWSKNSERDVMGYNVYRSENDIDFSKINTSLVKATSYTDSGLVDGKTYYYKIGAVDYSNNESLLSDSTSGVSSNLPPSVTVAYPSAGQLIKGLIRVKAEAQDLGGVGKVEFFIDDNLRRADTTYPYSCDWDTYPEEDTSHTIKAVAYDKYGLTATDSIVVDVDNNVPPRVSISNPSMGQVVKGQVEVTASVQDDVSVEKVEFFIDGNSKLVDTSNPYVYSWDTELEANGSHTIKVTALDNQGKITTEWVMVAVNNGAGPPPPGSESWTLTTQADFESGSGSNVDTASFPGDVRLVTTGLAGVTTMEARYPDVGGYSSLALDSKGNAHMSYYDSTNGDLKYATNVSGLWVSTVVDSSGNVGKFCSIALDSNDKVHISYVYCSSTSTHGNLKYATNASGSWVKITVDPYGAIKSYTSIAIDSNDKVHISYSWNYSYDHVLRYATNASGSWVTSTLLSQSISSPSIAIDTSNKVHISYYDGYRLCYMTNVSGSWVESRLETIGYSMESYPTSIALDSNDKIHISYTARINSYPYAKYITNASGSWVDTSFARGTSASIAIDSNNKVHICYSLSSTVGLIYTTNASGSWVTSTVEPEPSGGYYSSIALDASNKVHMSYQDSSGGLKYATNVSGSWDTCYVDKGGGASYTVGLYTSIAVDSNNKSHISYAGWNCLKYTTNASGEWVTTTVNNQGGAYSSIAVDSKGKVHISDLGTWSDYGGPLRYTTNASGSWVTYVLDVNPEPLTQTGQHTSIAIDSNDKVHISYFDWNRYNTYAPCRFDLKYITNASGSWVKSVVDNNLGYFGGDTSLALDSNNKAHIAYFNYDQGALKYASNASGSWATSALDGGGMYPSIAIDSNNKVHISHSTASSPYGGTGALRYVSNASGNWIATTIDSDDYRSEYTSIALDSNDNVHISYYNSGGNCSGLKYATNASGEWAITGLDYHNYFSPGYVAVGQYSSIALDSNDKIHVSYYDATNQGLRYYSNKIPFVSSGTIGQTGAGLRIKAGDGKKVNWSKLRWDAKIPEKTAINVYLKPTDDVANWTGAYGPAIVLSNGNNLADETPSSINLSEVATQGLEIKVELTSQDGDNTPVLRDLKVAVDAEAPTVKITNPSNGSLVKEEVEVTADTADNVGVEKVEFYLDGVLQAVTVSSSSTYTWKASLEPGSSHTIKAKAYDFCGNTSSDEITVSVDNTAPESKLLGVSPDDHVKDAVNITGEASDDLGLEKVEFYVDDVLKATSTTASLTYSWDTTQDADGSHTVKLIATDRAGNQATDTCPVVIDNLLPATSLTTDPSGSDEDNGWFKTAPLVGFVANELGDTYYQVKNADTKANVFISLWFTYQGENITLFEGETTISYLTIDQAGNVEPLRTSIINVDVTSPSIPSPDDGIEGVSNNNTPTFSWVPSTDAISGVAGYYYKVDDGAEQFTAETSVTLPAQLDGTHTFLVRAKDNACHLSDYGTHQFMIDTVAPVVTIDSPADNSLFANSNVTVAGITEPQITVKLYDNSNQVAEVATDATGAWSCNLTLSEGEHTLAAIATDAAGNKSEPSGAVRVIIDTTSPALAIASPLDGALTKGTVSIEASATDNVGVAKVEFYVDGVLKAVAVSPYTYAWDTTLEIDGSHTIKAVAFDEAGNTTTDEITVTVDNTAPAEPVITSPASPYLTNSTSVALEGTAEASSTVNVYNGGSLIGTASADGAGAWTMSLTLAEGTHSLTAKAKDLVGNESLPSSAVDVIVDLTPPACNITSPSNEDTIAGQTNISVNATDNVGVARVEFYVDGVLKQTDTSSPYTYSLDTTQLLDGPHAVEVKAYDTVGNSRGNTVNVAVDNSPPTASIAAPADGSYVPASFSVSANASDANKISKVEFYIGGVLKVTDITAPYSYVYTATAEGLHAIKVIAYDPANHQASDTHNVTVDSKSPTISNLAPANGGTVNTAKPTISAICSDSGGTYTKAYTTREWISGGSALGIRGDNTGKWYTLPFTFPFYGTSYTQVYVSSNGLLNFKVADNASSNSTSSLMTKTAIAPLWDDLRTDKRGADNVYVSQPTSNSVCIRWQAVTRSGNYDINFEVILSQDGTIRFNYGNCSSGSLSQTIGVSKGDSINYMLAHEGLTKTNNIQSVLFSPTIPGSEVDPATIVMKLDGGVVSCSYDTLTSKVSYVPATNLSNGLHVVELSAKDKAGNLASVIWSFTVSVR